MSSIDTTPLPASKDAYSFDETTREYLGVVEVFLSPLEGTYFLPRNVVDVPPPSDIGNHQRAQLHADKTAWNIVPDFRRCMLWDTGTGDPIPNSLALGDALPKNVTAEAPPVLSSHQPWINVWDDNASAWHQLPDYSRTPTWSKDTAQLAASPKPGQSLPDTLTVIAPPVFDRHQAPRWNDQRDDWELVADYRGVAYWTADGVQHVIRDLGVEPPADALDVPPALPATDNNSVIPAPTTDEA